MQKEDTTGQKPRNTEREIENLAEMISAVLSNPYTPDTLSNKIIDALGDLNNSAEIWENPHAVEALLQLYDAENGAQ